MASETKEQRDIQKLQRWMERHPDIEKMDALWCCEGVFYDAGYSWYVAVVIARAESGPAPRTAVAAFRATSPMALVTAMGEAGVLAPDWQEVRRLCESAGSNPRLTPRARRANDQAFAEVRP